MRLWGDRLSDLSSGSSDCSMRFKPGRRGLVLVVRMWLAFYNLPAFTNLRLNIHADDTGSLGDLIFSSNSSFSLDDVTSKVFSARELSFEFNAPWGVRLNTSLHYHLALTADGYTGTANSHIAALKAWPNPAIITEEPTLEGLARAPYAVAFVGAIR